MPRWGLTPNQIEAAPWGLPASELQPAKTITDPIHGDIYVTELEKRFLDSVPMQRLRRVRQLGTTHLVYPAATHSRFSHALGALRAAQDLVDAVLTQRKGPRAVPDLFAEWEADAASFHRKTGEVVVAARLGALLHDICHVPFGHTIEDELQLLTRHDANLARFEAIWGQLPYDLQALLPDLLVREMRGLILSKDEDSSDHKSSYPFVADIVGNTICADLIDYLPRDHHFLGLPLALGNRFIAEFYVTRTDQPLFPERMVVKITRNGHERADVVSELLKYLRYRYELSERALTHHAKLAADAMVGKLLAMWRDVLWVETAGEAHAQLVRDHGRDVDQLRRHIGELGERPSDWQRDQPFTCEEIDDAVTSKLERDLINHGDDGLLEHIQATYSDASKNDGRRRAVGTIASNLLNRQLFKMLGNSSEHRLAKDIFERFGGPDERRRLEQGAARYAGVSHKWQIVLWIPPPEMKLKAAEVLVDTGDTVVSLASHDHVGLDRAREIYQSHEALWSVSVFAHRDVRADDSTAEVILAWIREQIGSGDWEGRQVRTLPEIAADEVARELAIGHDQFGALVAIARGATELGGEMDTFVGLRAAVRDAATHLAG